MISAPLTPASVPPYPAIAAHPKLTILLALLPGRTPADRGVVPGRLACDVAARRLRQVHDGRGPRRVGAVTLM